MAAQAPLLLIVDASLSNKLATQLSDRGRPATALSQLGIAGLPDEQMLQHLDQYYAGQSWVMVTADDAMPAVHGATIAQLNTTIATIQGTALHGPAAEHWKRETVHRWAHKMATQQQGTIRRYSPSSHRIWTPPK